MNEQYGTVNKNAPPNIIGRVYSGNPTKVTKVLDIRANLRLASVQCYGQIHQVKSDSANGVYPSRLRLTICEKPVRSNGSTTIGINIEPYLAYVWLEVARKNIGTAVYPYKVENGKTENDMFTIIGAFFSSTSPINGFVNTLLNKTYLRIKRQTDYAFSTETYYNGVLTQLVVNRRSFDQNGMPSNYPWYIRIVSGNAPSQKKGNGKVVYLASKMTNKQQVSVNISDEDWYRLILSVTHYIEAWEMAYAPQLIRDGEMQRHETMMQYNVSQQLQSQGATNNQVCNYSQGSYNQENNGYY